VLRIRKDPELLAGYEMNGSGSGINQLKGALYSGKIRKFHTITHISHLQVFVPLIFLDGEKFGRALY
jgi:hypothetical protein